MKNLIYFFANNRMLVNIIIFISIMIGLYSYYNIDKESFPSTDLELMILQVVYPGASPLDVEQNAVIQIEDQLRTISGIDEYTSIITENAAIIFVQLDMEIDTSKAKDDIFRKMQSVPDMAEEVETIEITDINPKLTSIYKIGVHFKKGFEGDEKVLYDFSKELERQLKYVDGVADITVQGRTDPEVKILADPKKLQEYYISLTDIVNSLSARNIRATSGDLKKPIYMDLEENEEEKTVVTMGQFENPSEATNVVVRSTFNGQRVRIQDLAKVNSGFVEKSIYVRINSVEGYSLSIQKKENADIVKTTENINAFLKNNQHLIPENVEVTTMGETSRMVLALTNVSTSNLIFGFIIILIVLLIFLDFKSALFTSIGMIVVIFITFSYIHFSDLTFNIISLAGIITVIGMVVDNSIVVCENIYDFQKAGKTGLEGTVEAVKDVVSPIMVATMTTVVAFMPMLLTKDVVGKLIAPFPKVVMVALIASLFQAIFLLPNNLQDKTKKNFKLFKNIKNPLDFDKEKLFNAMKNPFNKALKILLKFRYLVVLFFIVLLIFSFFLAKDSLQKFILIYDTSSDSIMINIDSGIGNSIKNTMKYVEQIENVIYKSVDAENLIAVNSIVGKQVNQNIVDISEESANLAGITVYLIPSTERKKTAYDIMDDINRELEKTSLRKELDALMVSVKLPMDPGKAVDIKIVGNDLNQTRKVRDEVKAYLLSLSGVINYYDDDKAGKNELRVLFDYDEIAQLGMNVANVANELRTAYSGAVATSIQELDYKLDFRVQLDRDYIFDTNVLNNLVIPNTYSRLLYLKNVANIIETNGVSSIRHYNGQRCITINADLVQGQNTSIQVMFAIQNKFKDISQRYPGVIIGFGGEADQTVGALDGLAITLLIAIVLIYLILLLQFKKFAQPLMIMFLIPFTLTGVFIAFYLHGMPMSFIGFIGIVGLCGVLVNDGIIMIDLINKIIESGKSNPDALNNPKKFAFDSIVEGATQRLLPIFLTTVTTVGGLMPTVYGIGGDADLIVPIVMSLAYGLIFSTLITLIFLPCVFMIAVDLKLIKLK
ncbi:acriflavin resistance protein [Brachyspira hampsonii 30446]|uniref:Acriflavin resistance protein n=3 Tax=Brachyspira hampsonii TaxID=1287055 RepID=A0A2U4F1G2_9SPIR|nr:efflux RND transporter permease subunit [Brachyspira hampsonii]EKV56107.1 acriflavin resistance protein [Brachyspira hampsonii 30446]OEJ18083.1 acriflavin resistance protein [Brachyspira hampsonii]